MPMEDWKESKERRPTKEKQKSSYVAHLSPDMGKKDAAESTRKKHIQMGAKTTAKPWYNPCEAVYKPATKKHEANMAKKAIHTEMDP